MNDDKAEQWIGLVISCIGVVILGSIGLWGSVAGLSLWVLGGFFLKVIYRD